VTFNYSPDSFKLGLYLSLLAGVVLTLTLAYVVARRFLLVSGQPRALRRVAKNTVTPIAAQALGRCIDLGFAVVTLQILGPREYGGYAFAGALIGYFAIVTDFGLGTLLTRDVARDPLHFHPLRRDGAQARAHGVEHELVKAKGAAVGALGVARMDAAQPRRACA